MIANMVGTGIFTTSGFIMEELGNPQAMLLCWLVGGIFALCGALCFLNVMDIYALLPKEMSGGLEVGVRSAVSLYYQQVFQRSYCYRDSIGSKRYDHGRTKGLLRHVKRRCLF